MKSIETVPRNTSRPKRVGSPRIPGVPDPLSRGPSPSPGPSPPPPGALTPETPGARFSGTLVAMLRGELPHGSRVRLHHVVGVDAGDAVVVRPPVDLGDRTRPVPVPRRRRRRPLEPVGVPGIRRRLRSLEGAPQQVDQEDELGGAE